MEAKERLWLTADGKRLVADGDAAAATLYAAPGDEIPDEAAKRFGLKSGRLGKKRAAAAKNKEAAKPDDKGSPAEARGAKAGGKRRKD